MNEEFHMVYTRGDQVEKKIFKKTIDGELIEITEEVDAPEQFAGSFEAGAKDDSSETNEASSDESTADEKLSAEIDAELAKQPVTKDMNIKYILSLHPESSVILMSIGMGCISCFAAEMESLAEACVVHGLDPDDVTEYLNGELGLLPVE